MKLGTSIRLKRQKCIYQGIFQTYIDYRTLHPLCKNYTNPYFDAKHLEKGLNRGRGKIFGALFSKNCPFWPISNAALNFQNMSCIHYSQLAEGSHPPSSFLFDPSFLTLCSSPQVNPLHISAFKLVKKTCFHTTDTVLKPTLLNRDSNQKRKETN